MEICTINASTSPDYFAKISFFLLLSESWQVLLKM